MLDGRRRKIFSTFLEKEILAGFYRWYPEQNNNSISSGTLKNKKRFQELLTLKKEKCRITRLNPLFKPGEIRYI